MPLLLGDGSVPGSPARISYAHEVPEGTATARSKVQVNFASFYLTMGVFVLVLLCVLGLHDSATSDDPRPLDEDEWKQMMRMYFDQKLLVTALLFAILAWPVALVFVVVGRRK